jgi:hypothetical protein
MLEKDIETKVCKHANGYGVLTRKYTSPSHRSVPDRLFLFPTGLAVFIEFKQAGKKPTKGQMREMKKLRELGHYVYVVDDVAAGKKLVDDLMAVVSRKQPTSLLEAAKMKFLR